MSVRLYAQPSIAAAVALIIALPAPRPSSGAQGLIASHNLYARINKKTFCTILAH